MFGAVELFDLEQTTHGAVFDGCGPAWEALPKIARYLEANPEPAIHGEVSPQATVGERVFIGEGTVVEPGAMISGPAIIGANCTVRHNAYIRANVIVGDDCMVGNACELKNCLLFNGCEVPHFNYVGDSILGHRAHLGAGVVLSNVKVTPGNVRVEGVDTGLRKFGALIGDASEIGCNSVLNPGSIIGRDCTIYPNTTWRGVLEAGHIVKCRTEMEVVEKDQ
ncbi:MAG: UDP-N-acetylglucosamine diphosphorylase [Verrucomicrobiales bacterium]|nr:UDP-N-acetylglucosamine diphosphorylase [Verrucomicrobiales bacterium]|tara:strand:- start:16349 stop:17014 length:666 start_codon:yes stop_codon:yes gene_type:complete